MTALRAAIASVKADVYVADGNKRKQAEKMLAYLKEPLRSKRYPDCEGETPEAYACKLHDDRVVTTSMIRELRREIQTCEERLGPKRKTTTAKDATGKEDGGSGATDALIANQIAYVKEQRAKGKISEKEAAARIAKYHATRNKLKRNV